MKHFSKLAALIALTGLCLFGTYWSARAGLEKFLYYHVRYGHAAYMGLDESRPLAETVPRRLELAERAMRFYSRDFDLYEAAAVIAYSAIDDHKNVDHGVELADVRLWCDRGLALNPHAPRLNHIDAEIIAATSPRDALVQWQKYLDWCFWDTFNHYYVVELLARAGRFEDAFQHLRWLKGRTHYDDARRIIRYEWQEQERQMREYLQERSR